MSALGSATASSSTRQCSFMNNASENAIAAPSSTYHRQHTTCRTPAVRSARPIPFVSPAFSTTQSTVRCFAVPLLAASSAMMRAASALPPTPAPRCPRAGRSPRACRRGLRGG
eukprot:3870318-Rhodomonas_salina.1